LKLIPEDETQIKEAFNIYLTIIDLANLFIEHNTIDTVISSEEIKVLFHDLARLAGLSL
jgi:elongation factor P--beta-lysine ligase